MHASFEHTRDCTRPDNISPLITLIGLLGMIVSISANVRNMEEMYSPFEMRFVNEYSFDEGKKPFLNVPLSLILSCISDICLCIYGIYNQDIVVAIYGSLNTSVVLLTMFSLQSRQPTGSDIPYVNNTHCGGPKVFTHNFV